MTLSETTSPSADRPINLLADLRLHQRKAFELCAVLFGALRACGADPDEDALKAASQKAQRLAEAELRTQNDDVQLEMFLADALEKVVREALETAENFPFSEAGRCMLSRLQAVQEALPEHRTTEACCIIKSTYAACVATAVDFYSVCLATPYHLPDISLRIGVSDGPNTAFPGRVIAFNGSVRYQDGDGGEGHQAQKHSVVTMKTAPARLDRGCLPALPYVLMHEILCHWPQMARRVGARPNPRTVDDPRNKDAKWIEVDPFSEGWMDSLVAEVLRRRCTSADGACWEEANHAEAIHGERTQINRQPAFADAVRIAPGKTAAELVRWLYATDPKAEPQNADPDFHRLSCELNAADWSYDERREGCKDIILACRAYVAKVEHGKEPSARHRDILDSLLTFRRSGDLASLLRVLMSR